MRLTILLLPLAAMAAPLCAEPGLPDAALVNAALDEHPSVQAAQAQVEAARAEARARSRGPHELTFSGSYSRRTIDREGEYDEYDAQLSRAFRLPGKAALDRAIGSYGLEEAENLAEDAKHQAALILMGHWFDWLGASAEAQVDEQAVANYERALAAVRRRMELRDAAELEVDQTEAALAGARVLADQSLGRARLARVRLETHFPSLPVPADASEIPPPAMAEEALGTYGEAVILNSHEIAAAEARVNRFESLAERSRKERLGDPSVGVRLFSERGGEERGAGLVFSMPLGSGHRGALADQAAAEANAARSEAQLARFEVRETAAADVAEARYRLSAWHRTREGLQSQTAALTKLRRGHELGEIDLSDLLLAERLVHDAFRSEASARTEALRAITKLRIDSHELWLAD